MSRRLYCSYVSDDPFSQERFSRLVGLNVSVSTSLDRHVSILERFGIPGPQHLGILNLETQWYFDFLGQGAQFSVYGYNDTYELGRRVVLKRSVLARSGYSEVSASERHESWKVERQLQTMELEIRSLCHQEIRRDPNIVQLISWAYDYSNDQSQHPFPVLIMERADVCLSTAIRQDSSEQLSMVTKQHLCLDIASALECLEACGIVHGDLKPENVLLFRNENQSDARWVAKLADFGLSIALEEEEEVPLSRYRSTIGWQPPETRGSAARKTVKPSLLHKCDSYSYGLLALSLLAFHGASPFADNPETEALDSCVEHAEGVVDSATTLSPAEKTSTLACVRIIYRKLLAPDLENRASVKPEIFQGTVLSFSTWKAGNIGQREKASIESQAVYRRHNYRYWSFMDRTVFEQLDRDLVSSEGLQGDFLMGMAIASSVQYPPFRSGALRYMTDAANAMIPSKTAQGLLKNVHEALRESSRTGSLDPSVGFLEEASSDGCWVATKELSETQSPCLTLARQRHRDSGGYNKEKLLDNAPVRPESKRRSIEVPIREMTLLAIKEAEPSYFADLSTMESCREVVDLRGNTVLHLAAMFGRVDVLRLIASPDLATINQRNFAGETALYKACAAGHASAIKELLEFGADASITTCPDSQFAISCLHWLFLLDPEDMDHIADLLIRSGADVNARTAVIMEHSNRRQIPMDHFPFHWPHGTPLHWAAHVGSLDAAAVLLQHGAMIDQDDTEVDKRAHTPLGLAMLYGNSKMTEFLLEHGANCMKRDSRGLTPLHMLTTNLGSRNMSIPKPLSRWCYHGSWEKSLGEIRSCVQAFKNHGGDLDARRSKPGELTPLLDAALSGDSAAVIALLEAGANSDLTELWTGDLPLHIWAQNDPASVPHSETYWDALHALTSATKDCTQKNTISGETVLHKAVQNTACPDVAKRVISTILHELGSELSIESRNSSGQTPLLIAVNTRSRPQPAWTPGSAWTPGFNAQELARFLVDMGALSTAVRLDNNTDLIYHILSNDDIADERCLEMMLEHFSNLGLSENDIAGRRRVLNASRNERTGSTSLMRMVGRGFLNSSRYALSLGVDLNSHTEEGVTALDVALEAADVQRIRLLEQWVSNNIGAPPNDETIKAQPFLFEEGFVQQNLREFNTSVSTV